jgi:hypothetical protein
MLLDGLKDARGYYHLKVEALDRTMLRSCSGGGFVLPLPFMGFM